MKKTLPVFAMLSAVLLFVACKNENIEYFYYSPEEKAILDQHLDLPDLPSKYTAVFPEHLARQGLFPRPISDDKATLGRVIFYDKKLSKDGKVACANCHKAEFGFGDNTAVSLGVEDREGDRNSIALGSVANFSAYYGTDLNGSSAIRFFWDNRAETAEAQSRGSMTNPQEMDMHMSEIVNVVRSQPYYEPLFNKAFAGKYPSSATEENVLDAIANFVDAMGSFQSKFDVEAAKKYQGNYNFGEEPVKEDFPGFTASENRGKQIYMTRCASCHNAVLGRPNLNNASNGLDAAFGEDLGVGAITNIAYDKGTFKVPTLRNIAVTAPYMHDGRFKSLEEVVEHYSTGIKSHPNLAGQLPAGGFNFSTAQKQDIIAFLNTMTDNALVIEERFANPFK